MGSGFEYVRSTFRVVAMFVVVLILIRTFIIEPGVVNGRSMEPTYIDNTLFLIDKFSLLLREPRRGEIVQAINPVDKTVLIKRVVGLPGERLAIKEGSLFLVSSDGSYLPLDEPYLPEGMKTLTPDGSQDVVFLPVPENSYFLLGDNRPMSGDSRVYGSIHRSYIYGLVMDVSFGK
jgi:signal peptidase I